MYYDKFGVTGTKNIEMAEGGPLDPPGFVDSKKPGLCRVNRNSGLVQFDRTIPDSPNSSF